MEAAARTFFSSPQFAVVGASQDAAKFGHKVYAWYIQHSLPVEPINPRAKSITVWGVARPTVPDIASLANPSETSISIITPPTVTMAVLQEAKKAGVPAVWLQPGSFDQEGLAFANKEFKAAVGGDDGVGGDGEGWCILVDGEAGLKAARQVGKL